MPVDCQTQQSTCKWFSDKSIC